MRLNYQTSNSPQVPQKTQAGLYQQAARGGVWSFATRLFLQLISLPRIFILAWLLEPQDFGLLGVALLTVAIIESFTTTGFQAALIQKKGTYGDYLDSVWTFGLVRAVLLFTILYLTAPYTAIFFDCPGATSIIRVIGVSVILRSLNSAGTIRFQKELRFRKSFIHQSSGTVADFAVSITLACLYKSVWALVAGKLAGEFVRLVLGYILEPYRPRLQLKIEKIRELRQYGRWVMGSVILGFLQDKGDDILVGKVLGVASLGLYRIAYNISNIPTTEITCALSHVTFPAYTKIQNDIPRLKAAYLKVLNITMLFSLPIAGLIFAMAEDFLALFMKAEWSTMLRTLQILAVWGVFRTIGTTSGPVFNGTGHPKISTYLQFLRLALICMLIYPLTLYEGIAGTATAILASSVAIQPIVLYKLKGLLHCKIRDFAKRGLGAFIGTLVMIGLVAMLRYWLCEKASYVSFFLLVAAGIIGYLGTVRVFDKLFGYQNKEVIRELIMVMFSPKKQNP